MSLVSWLRNNAGVPNKSSSSSSSDTAAQSDKCGMAFVRAMKSRTHPPKLQMPGRPQNAGTSGEVVSFSQKRTAEEFLPGCTAGLPDRQVMRLETPVPRQNPVEQQVCNLARKELKAAIQEAWNSTDLTDSTAVFWRIANNIMTLPEAKHKVVDLLEIPLIKRLDPVQYASVVALAAHVDAQLDPRYYTKLLVLLIQQSPVNASLVRLTLNMSLGEEQEILPLTDPNARRKAKAEPVPAAEPEAEEPRIADWNTARFVDMYGEAAKEALENDEDWREKALEASLGKAKVAPQWQDREWGEGKKAQKAAEVFGGGDDLPVYWLTLTESSSLAQAGYPLEAPALLHNKSQKVFSSATNIMMMLVNDINKDITIEHDDNWTIFPEIRHALIEAKAYDEAYAVAKCPALKKWAVGIGPVWKTRELAAKLALAVAISKGHEGRITLIAHFPEMQKVSDKAELCGAPVAGLKPIGDDPGPDQNHDEVGDSAEAQTILSRVDPVRVRGRVKTDDPLCAAYYGHFMLLLHLETLVELKSLEERQMQSEQDLVRQGSMLKGMWVRDFSVQGKSKTVLPGASVHNKKKVRIVFQGKKVDWSRVRFRPGDWVSVSRTSPLTDSQGEGLVHAMPAGDEDGAGSSFGMGDGLVIMLDTDLDDATAKEGVWRIDKAANRTAYERQMMALLKLANASKLSRPKLFTALIVSGVGGLDSWATKLQGGGAISGGPTSEGQVALQQIASEEPTLSQEGKEKLQLIQGVLTGGAPIPPEGSQELNHSQRLAIASALGRRLTLIQGPPGTGKTHVSVSLMTYWARGVTECWPLLATSGSNIAVDNIAEGCIRAGLKVVRIGRPEKVSPQLEQCTLESLLKQGGGTYGAADIWASDEDNEKQRQYSDRMKVLKEADVICATTIVAGSDFLAQIDFGACLIDEVAQATELSAIVPVFLRNPGRLVLVGDHCQLPPNSCSLEAERRGVTLSLFGRLHSHGLESFFLDTQFRMHPKIAEFSSRQFYEGKLNTGITAQDRPSPKGFDWPSPGNGVAFINCDGREQRDGDSFYNNLEAGVIADVLEKVLAAGGTSILEIGVVSPYSAQVRGMKQWLRKELAERLPGMDLTGGLQGKRAKNALEIASVDAFQGREKDLIIFSAVRCNSNRSIGFLADWRRLNVMLTRARCGIIVIGNGETLRSDPTWARWLDWAKRSNFYVSSGYGRDWSKSDWSQSNWSNSADSSWSSWPTWDGGKGGKPAWSNGNFQHQQMAAMFQTMLSAAWSQSAWSNWD